jgi:hypothetical protein
MQQWTRALGPKDAVATVLERAAARDVDVLESLITALQETGRSDDIPAVLRGIEIARRDRERRSFPPISDNYPAVPLCRREAIRLVTALRATPLDEANWSDVVRVPTRRAVAWQWMRQRLRVADWQLGPVPLQPATYPVLAFLLGTASVGLFAAPEGIAAGGARSRHLPTRPGRHRRTGCRLGHPVPSGVRLLR